MRVVYFVSVYFFLGQSQSCLWSGSLDRDDCEDFEKLGQNCDNIYQGRLQAAEMTADLYKVLFNIFFGNSFVFLVVF